MVGAADRAEVAVAAGDGAVGVILSVVRPRAEAAQAIKAEDHDEHHKQTQLVHVEPFDPLQNVLNELRYPHVRVRPAMACERDLENGRS